MDLCAYTQLGVRTLHWECVRCTESVNSKHSSFLLRLLFLLGERSWKCMLWLLSPECTCKFHKNIKTQSSRVDPRGSRLGASTQGKRGLKGGGGEMKVWREAEERCDAEDWDKWPSFHIAEDILTQNLDKMIMHGSCQKQSLWLIVSHAHSPRSFYPPPPLSTELTESIQTSAAALKPLKLQVSQFTTELSEPWQPGSESEGKLKVFLFPFFFFMVNRNSAQFCSLWKPKCEEW